MSQTSDNNKRIAKNTLLFLYDGGVVVYEPCHIECVGSGGLEYTYKCSNYCLV